MNDRSRSIVLLLLSLASAGCEKAPDDVVRAYLAARTYQARAAFVRHPEQVRELMHRNYGDDPLGDDGLRRTVNAPVPPRPAVGEWTVVRVDVTGKNGFGAEITKPSFYLLEHTKEGYRIDWEASVGYNPISWEAFKARRPTAPMRLRLEARLSDYYNYEFRAGRESFWAVSVAFAWEYPPLTAYVLKDSEAGRALSKALESGNTSEIVADARFLPGTQGDTLVIDHVVKTDTWLLDDATAPDAGEKILAAGVVPQVRFRDLLESVEQTCKNAAWGRAGCDYSIASRVCDEQSLPAVVSCARPGVQLDEFAACLAPKLGDLGAEVDQVCGSSGSVRNAVAGLGNEFMIASSAALNACVQAVAANRAELPSCSDGDLTRRCRQASVEAAQTCLGARNGAFRACMVGKMTALGAKLRGDCKPQGSAI